MSISAEQVRALREKTGLPLMDCKRALTESGGDEDKAIEWLRKAGLGRVEKMADRVASEGRIACYVDAKTGRAGICELRCETAPVASTEDFVSLAAAVAQVAAGMENPTPESVSSKPLPGNSAQTVGDRLHEVFNRIREKMQIARVASVDGPVGSYIHHNAQVGVIVQFSEPCPPELAADICMHVTAMKPRCTNRDQVAPEEVAREREAAKEAAKGKPEPVVEKIVSGKLDRWFADFVLLEQPFVKDDKRSVAQVLKDISPKLTVRQFLRFEVGGA